MELAPGWGRVGTVAWLAWLARPRAREGLRGGGHPLTALMTRPYGRVALVSPVGVTAAPLLGTGAGWGGGAPCSGLAACRG